MANNTFNTVLPNGTPVNGVPVGTSWVDIAKDAIRQGAATPEDFVQFPEIYSQLGQQKNSNKPQTMHSAGGGFAGENGSNANKLSEDAQQLQQVNPIAAASMGYSAMLADNGKVIDEHPQVAAAAGALALAPVTAGLSLPAAYAADATSQLVADSAAHGIETNGADAMPEHPFQDVILPIPGVAKMISKPVAAAAKVVAPVVKSAAHEVSSLGEDIGVNALIRRFSPRTAATVKGMADGGGLDAAAEEKIVDRAPQNDAIKTVEEGQDRAKAEQAMLDQQFMEHATRLHSAIEGTSYAGGALKAGKTGAPGKEAADALRFYRAAISPYESTAIARGELVKARPDLEDFPYYEILMRSDSGELDSLIQNIDDGKEVDPAHFLDALEAYQVNQNAQLKAFAKRLPQAYAKDIQSLARAVPGVDGLISDAVRMGLAPERVSAKMAKDYQQAFTSAVADYADKTAKALSDEADSIRSQMVDLQKKSKNNPRLKAVLTAMKHSSDTLDQMVQNISDGMNTGTMKNGVDYSDIAMLRSMAATHSDAAHLEALYQRYAALESGFNSLPVARAKMDKTPFVESALGGVETAITARTFGANRVAKAVLGKPIEKAIAAPVRRVRRAAKARQAISEVNKLVEESKKSK